MYNENCVVFLVLDPCIIKINAAAPVVRFNELVSIAGHHSFNLRFSSEWG